MTREPNAEELLAALSDSSTGAFSVLEVAERVAARRGARVRRLKVYRGGKVVRETLDSAAIESYVSVDAVRVRLRSMARAGAVVVLPGSSGLVRRARALVRPEQQYYTRRDRLTALAAEAGVLDAALSILARRHSGELREVVSCLARGEGVDGVEVERAGWSGKDGRDRLGRVVRGVVREVHVGGELAGG